jgi:energy-coupling factor transporter ATP-binding protein EcfA2
MEDLWARSRAGSHAGRGFHYQDAVATELALRAWRGMLPVIRLIPEGLEDISLELETYRLHLQVKSRRGHRGDFSPADLSDAWRHLAERASADTEAHVGLVLERPLAGVECGLECTVVDTGDVGLKRAITAAIDGVITPRKFLSRAHVLVMPASQTTAVDLLAEGLSIPSASCMAHYAILRGVLAQIADENGVRPATDPAVLTAGDTARLIDDVSEAIDPSALDEAVRTGIAELVDFATPIKEPRFFSGVDVVVGHIVAGLPLDRGDLVEKLNEGLEARRAALAVGPSGAGKSALIWLAAFVTRHRIRWYRIRRLRDDDVPAVVRLVKSLNLSGVRIGFVVDDLGRDDRLGFDRLVEELREYPDTFVLGACREEDLFVVRTAHKAAQVRPTLDEALAQRIWNELRARDQTEWAEWREPYEACDGLLLEYGYLLTEGTRLEETIAEQIERRVREERADELDLLARIATADTFGVELEVSRLRAALGLDDTRMKRALSRLIDEHLIRERDGLLGGLHEVRSRHIMREIHRVPPPVLDDSVRSVIDLVDPVALRPFLTRLLLEEAVADEVAVAAVAERVTREADANALAEALHALRLVAFRRMAEQWRPIIEEEEVARTSVGVVSHFALQGGDYSFLPEPFQHAIDRIRDLEYVDIRAQLLARIEDYVPRVVAVSTSIGSASAVLAALGEIGESVEIVVEQLASLADGAPLLDLRLLFESAYGASPTLAVALAEELRGSEALLNRLQQEQPWLRDAHVDTDDDGRPIATARYAFVAEAHQPEPHGAVVDLARSLAAFAPTAEVAVCCAVDATGETAGFGGVPLADKEIDRRNLPGQAQIAWNRARGRAAIAAVAAPTVTDHLLAARDIVTRSAGLVRAAGDTWARGRPPSERLIADAVALAEATIELAPPPIAIEVAGPLDEGDLPTSDPVGFIGTMIPNNLFIGLFQGDPVAPLIPQIIEQVDKLAEEEPWRLLQDPPTDDIASLRRTLVDLHAVVAERSSGDRVSLAVLQVVGKNGLAAAACVARERAGERMGTVASDLELELRKAGFAAQIIRREGQPDSHRWPSDDFLILIETPSIYAWWRKLEAIVDICRPALEDRVGFSIAPIREGHIVGRHAVKVLTDVFPESEIREWSDLPVPFLDERITSTCDRGLSALVEVSGVLASAPYNERHEEEVAVAKEAMKVASGTLGFFNDLYEKTKDPLILEIGGTLLGLTKRVEEEASALVGGTPVKRGVAASVIHGLKGDADDVYWMYLGLIAACVEWDVDPADAWSLFQEESGEETPES